MIRRPCRRPVDGAGLTESQSLTESRNAIAATARIETLNRTVVTHV